MSTLSQPRTIAAAELCIEGVMERSAARSRHQWALDLWVLNERYGIALDASQP